MNSTPKVRRYVILNNVWGVFMPKGKSSKKYTEEFKQRAVEDVRRNGLSNKEAMRKYEITGIRSSGVALFVRYIEEAAARSDSRKDYQRVCAIIRKLKKAGGKEQAARIKQKLLAAYPKRPAFQDEWPSV